MGLFDFLKPKWKNSNPDVRRTAVLAMGAADVGTLKAVASGDEDLRVQLAAIERIDDRSALEELIGGGLAPDVSRAVRAKIDRLLCEEALGGAAVDGLEVVLDRIEDRGLVERLAAQAPTPAVRMMAVGRVGDPNALCRIVETHCGKGPARVALAKIDDERLLARIARTGASKATRRLAAERLAAAGAGAERVKPADGARGDREPGVLAEEAETLVVPDDREVSERRLPVLEALQALEALVGSTDEGADERFRGALATWTSVGVGADSALTARFDTACERYRAAREVIEEERRYLGEHTAELDRASGLREPGDLERVRRALTDLHRRAREGGFRYLDPASLLIRLEASRRECEERVAARVEDEARVRRELLERRAQLCAEFEGLLEAPDGAAAGRRVKELRTAWKALSTSAEKESRALEERFGVAAKRFAARQAAFHEQQDWLRWNNRTVKEELCIAVEVLETEEDLSVVADKVKEAQRRWKETGPAPRAAAEALRQRFHAACDHSFERCKPYFGEQESRRAESIERREELCRQAEAHGESTEWKESAETLKRLQAAWKEAGPIPRERDRELYARFRRACDRFFERRQVHLTELDESRRGNQDEKERLCERAEALAAEPDPGHAREFRELQAAWKRLGPAPRDAEQPLWERFRGSCDRFFAWSDAGRRQNLREKEVLCAEVEAFMAGVGDDADPQETTAKIAEFQKHWNEVGPVPKGEVDAIWERFHRPVDEFFEARRGRSALTAVTGETLNKNLDDARYILPVGRMIR